MSKLIVYREEEYQVPNWVKYVATDENGVVWGYEEKPSSWEFSGDWQAKGRYVKIYSPDLDWENSLEAYD